MEDRDIAQVGELFTRYMQRFGMAPIMTLDEIKHQFLSGKGKGERAPGTWKGRRDGQVVWTYVVEVRTIKYSKHAPRRASHFQGSTYASNYGFLLILYAPVYHHWQHEAFHS